MIWRISQLIDWFQEKREEKYYAWAIKHIDELPIEPTIVNAGQWVKIEDSFEAPASGVYLFLCRGDNHLLYEVHELLEGADILYNFTEEKEHGDGWFTVKPLYYYYIPFRENK